MNVEIFTEIDSSGFTDSEKVFAGLLTFLYQKYPNDEQFTLYQNDTKTILDIGTAAGYSLPKPFRVGSYEPKRALFTMGYIEDRESTELVPIAESQACTVQGFLLALYRTREDWDDKENTSLLVRPMAFQTERKNRLFMPHEREAFFQHTRSNRHGRYGQK